MKPIQIALVALVALALVAFFVLGRNRRGVERPSGQAVRDLRPLTSHLFKDAISVVKSATVAKSYFGGAPPRSGRYSWPTRDGRPLSFLACIDCSELPRSADLDWLPDTGVCYSKWIQATN